MKRTMNPPQAGDAAKAPAPQITLGVYVRDVIDGFAGEVIGLSVFKYEASQALVLGVRDPGGNDPSAATSQTREARWVQASRLLLLDTRS